MAACAFFHKILTQAKKYLQGGFYSTVGGSSLEIRSFCFQAGLAKQIKPEQLLLVGFVGALDVGV